jgi:hypothetical protein
MMPNKKEYTLGKGSLYLSSYDATTGLLTGERHLGNCKALTASNAIDYLDHTNHLSKTASRDVHFPLKTTPTIKAELDEMSPDNQALASLGTLVRETQQAGSIDTTFSAFKGRRTDVGKRRIGLYHLPYQASSSPSLFAPEEIVTGPTGEGTVIAVVGTATSGTLVILLTSGTFSTGAALSGSVSGDALAAGSAVFKPGLINVRNSAGAVTYSAGTDYIVSTTFKDDRIGRFYIPDTSTITDKSSVKVRTNYEDAEFWSVAPYTNLTTEYQLRFVSDHALGRNYDFTAWRVTASPDGDKAYIGDDWSTLSLMFEVLDDAANHPEHPYMKFNIEDLT